MANKHFQYLALSHMWGNPDLPHLKLLVSNIADFQKSIPWHKLSSIYQEAIRATLALGYKYLWIDSLCIIQDSVDKADWNYEARLMATVYGNASCNLAFLFPEFTPIKRSDPRDWNPCVLRDATPTEAGVSIQHTSRRSDDKEWLNQANWPLFTRAWTFQEYLLAPRTLLLGHRNLMFQCSKHFYDELLGPVTESPTISRDGTPYRGRAMGKWRYFPKSLTENWDQEIEMSGLTALKFATDWQACLNEYRMRDLTKAEDRIVAFAGVARAVGGLGCLTWLAGCWAEYFPLTLLWYVDRKSARTLRHEGRALARGEKVPVRMREEVMLKAPTWSQFSVPIYTHHQTYFVFNEDEVNARLRFEVFEGAAPPVYWHDIHWTYLDSFKYPGTPTEEFPDSGYADFEGLEVTLVMPLLPVRVSWVKDLERRFNAIRSSNALDADITWTPEFTYFPDDPASPSSPPKNGVLAIVSEFQLCRVPGTNNVERRLAGLVLVRGEREGTWRRVGAWKLKIRITGMDVHDGNVRDVAERWRGYKMCNFGNGEKWWMEGVTLV